jgi:hypothetical protein
MFPCALSKIRGGGGVGQFKQPSIPSFQHGMLESSLTWMFPEASLQIWMPAIHAGMTRAVFSSSVGRHKLINHLVVTYPRLSCALRVFVFFVPLCLIVFAGCANFPVVILTVPVKRNLTAETLRAQRKEFFN